MPSTTIARGQSSRGELVLRRREWDGELELRVNGVFVMDSYETSTERALATLALDSVRRAHGVESPPPLSVLVGGLGLGYTLAEFAASSMVATMIVSEIEPLLVDWHRAGLIPPTEQITHSPRVQLLCADVQDVVRGQPAGAFDVIVLDVDNGPGFLVYGDNAAIYQTEFLASCREALTSKGVLVVWSADEAPDLRTALAEVFGSASLHSMGVRRGDRVDSYHAYVAPGYPEEDETCPAH